MAIQLMWGSVLAPTSSPPPDRVAQGTDALGQGRRGPASSKLVFSTGGEMDYQGRRLGVDPVLARAELYAAKMVSMEELYATRHSL